MKRTWYAGSTGRFALNAQMSLLQSSLAAWPRRGKTLLEINCGRGQFLPLLWECGFDVTGTELAPDLRLLAEATAGSRAEVAAAADDHLPFEDQAFDCVILHVNATDRDSLAASAREALRVAASGLALTFWNSASLPYALYRLGGRKSPWPGPAHCWWRVWHILKKFRAGSLTGMSALAAPMRTWRAQCPLAACNLCLRTLPVGAWGVIRLDLGPLSPVTPLPLRVGRRRLRAPEPVMECGHKNTLGSPIKNSRKTP